MKKELAPAKAPLPKFRSDKDAAEYFEAHSLADVWHQLPEALPFVASHDDMNFTPPYLSAIQARTLIVQGDRDPLYPVELSIEMAKAIPHSALWIVPNSGHGPVLGEQWPAENRLGIPARMMRGQSTARKTSKVPW